MEDGKDEIEKGHALIRTCFYIEPETLPIERWAKLYQEAIYIKKLEAKTLAEVLVAVFGKKKI